MCIVGRLYQLPQLLPWWVCAPLQTRFSRQLRRWVWSCWAFLPLPVLLQSQCGKRWCVLLSHTAHSGVWIVHTKHPHLQSSPALGSIAEILPPSWHFECTCASSFGVSSWRRRFVRTGMRTVHDSNHKTFKNSICIWNCWKDTKHPGMWEESKSHRMDLQHSTSYSLCQAWGKGRIWIHHWGGNGECLLNWRSQFPGCKTDDYSGISRGGSHHTVLLSWDPLRTPRGSAYLRAVLFFLVLLLVETSALRAFNYLGLMWNVVGQREAFEIWIMLPCLLWAFPWLPLLLVLLERGRIGLVFKMLP